jgi:hypothetical protein
MESDPVSETLCFLVLTIPYDGQSKKPVIFNVIHHRQNPLGSKRNGTTGKMKLDIRGMGWGGMDRIDLDHDGNQ